MMLRLQKMEEQKKTLNINRLSIKNYIIRVADEVPRICKRTPVPMRCRHHVIEMARQLRAKGDNICKSGKSKRARMGAAAAAAMIPAMALMGDATMGAIASAMMPLASSLQQLRHLPGTMGSTAL